MTDKKAVSRVKKQREIRAAVGWHEVKVWVPTDRDADDVRNLAAARRAQAEALHGLSDEVPTVTPENASRIALAIAQHGSAAYTHASGAVLDLMTKLAEEDDLQSFARAFIILARARPTSAASAASFIPAKISNFLIKHRNVAHEELEKWTRANPDWTETLKYAIRVPQHFEQVVEEMAKQIKHPH